LNDHSNIHSLTTHEKDITMHIQDSVILVTGGNRGLGKSLVQAFLDAGARKIYVGCRTLIETSDPRLQPIKLDITNAYDVAAAAETCQDITILVNNAGIANNTTFITAPSLAQAREEIETNYIGPLAMARAFAPILKRNGGGTLVNVLSVLSWFTSPAAATYCASKYAELSLTEGIRIELRSQGTQVIAVYLGYMDTDMSAHINAPKTRPEEVAASIIEGIRNKHEEVFADKLSHEIKAALANNPKAFYQNIQEGWDKAQQQTA
jgi:NAD(P)-dependent dehydrogenase (short-subunit alcohol dehydrogenase family)